MKKHWISAALLLALTVVLAGPASAVQLKYTGQAYLPTFGSYYVGAYSAQMNPTGESWAPNSTNWSTQPTVAAICNDFSGRIATGDVWDVTAHEITLADLGGSPEAKFWGQSVTDTQADRGDNEINLNDYLAAAWLSDQLLTYHYNWSPTTAVVERTRLQYAIWTVFNSAATTIGSTADKAAVIAYRQAAFDAVAGGYTGSDWRVFTEVSATGKQEILIRVPEAASFATLGLNFGALVLLGYAFRRRMK
ncbi:MAG: hypothetical protein IH602_01010 [Bryobacteraceae bacterium]|nr:hypothetical protein [Bryobacteraceae bacterium]